MKKLTPNLIYSIINIGYLIVVTIGALIYCNAFLQIIDVYNIRNFPILIQNIFVIAMAIPFFSFYLMGGTFTILIHPIVQIIIFFIVYNKNIISKKLLIIIFIYSSGIAFVCIYSIWVKGYILTV